MFGYRLTEDDMKPLDDNAIDSSRKFSLFVMAKKHLHYTIRDNLTFLAAPHIPVDNSGVCLIRAMYADSGSGCDSISDITVSYEVIL